MTIELLEQLSWEDIQMIGNEVDYWVNLHPDETEKRLPKEFPGEEYSSKGLFLFVKKRLKEIIEKQVSDEKKRLPFSFAWDSLRELGYKPKWNPDQKSITFYYFGNKVTYFPKKQYFNGKGLEPGFGIEKLLEQLKERPMPKIK